jgi:hypothetical protein
MEGFVSVTFIPQVWVGRDRDYAETVEPLGADTWQVPLARFGDMRPRTHESDSLATEPGAPEWVQEWALTHPFEVEWDEEDGKPVTSNKEGVN